MRANREVGWFVLAGLSAVVMSLSLAGPAAQAGGRKAAAAPKAAAPDNDAIPGLDAIGDEKPGGGSAVTNPGSRKTADSGIPGVGGLRDDKPAKTASKKVPAKDPAEAAFALPKGAQLTPKQTDAYNKMKDELKPKLEKAFEDVANAKEKGDKAKAAKAVKDVRAEIQKRMQEIAAIPYQEMMDQMAKGKGKQQRAGGGGGGGGGGRGKGGRRH